MTPEEEKRIRDWHAVLSHAVTITLEVTEDRRSAELARFCDELAGVAPDVRVTRNVTETQEAPAIHIHPRLRYHAIPLGHELAPFLEAVSGSNNSDAKGEWAFTEELRNMKWPAVMKLYVMQQCPVCPQVVRQATALSKANKGIQLIIIDGVLFPEFAQADGIQATPTLLLDDAFRWTGPLRRVEIVDTLVHRDPAKLGAATLENIVLEGRALQLADMMIERGRIFPAFLDLLSHDRLPVRLGAMAAVEQVFEKNPTLANEVVEPLWERFPAMKESVKGDVLFIFGLLKNQRVIPRLQAILKGSYDDDVKEAAKEALDQITGRR
jgi:hypothetical protein